MDAPGPAHPLCGAGENARGGAGGAALTGPTADPRAQ
jgi:hypothetical protein